MAHLTIALVSAVFFIVNFYLWTMKQGQIVLLLEALVLSAMWYPVFFWYITRDRSHGRIP